MFDGLKLVEEVSLFIRTNKITTQKLNYNNIFKELSELNIPFYLLRGEPKIEITALVERLNLGGVIVDFSPLKPFIDTINRLKSKLPENIALAQVDGHNIVPVWVTSDKQEYSPRTIRNKVNNKLDEFLTEFPPLIKHSFSIVDDQFSKVDWINIEKTLECDRTVDKVDWIKAGYKNAINTLNDFMKNRLKYFNVYRCDPNKSMLSNLSPWYNFGQVSVQRCILEMKKNGKYMDQVIIYMEEA
jgi:deoxyribodipyrimidine photo-lyase